MTAEVDWRLLERVNDSLWPLQFLTVTLGLEALSAYPLIAVTSRPAIRAVTSSA